MSYNGIGLPSAKGSSTSGHIQRSLASTEDRDKNKGKAFLKRQAEAKRLKNRIDTNRVQKIDARDKNSVSDVKRDSLREIELRVSELRDNLEDKMDASSDSELTPEDIDKQCQQLRDRLKKDYRTRTAYTARDKRHLTSEANTINNK
ncbi:similar to Saccharomyces cerevisiae YDR482C CWC21 Protein involved in RNA splicing by the spliceosome [Maudiozyma saulgeensis]|uniref:Pre-mRNA-splicing factor CWC21 n=1 Tax=Maudiozyma saulgeensis TaxID=1789683 RepID=A0A1X7R5M0_9SACH|nr:similar to Saccharomyces cerevisiae YDR482C CWC21 Protein involved in RNA splicing by the spliceosome [Kazachstania saulgeensis]